MNEPETQNYEFGRFRVDADKRLLLNADGEVVPLTPKVFELLLYLVRNKGKVIEKDELMREIWTDTIVQESNLSQNVSILRRVLGEKRGEHQFIVTIPGRGYKFVAAVAQIHPPSDGHLANGSELLDRPYHYGTSLYTAEKT